MIANGHRLPDIMEYTLAQVTMFLEAIDKITKADSKLELTLLRVAQADKKGYETAWRKLFGVDG